LDLLEADKEDYDDFEFTKKRKSNEEIEKEENDLKRFKSKHV
jgi:hypothetical protein